MQRILMTGAAGAIGTFLRRELARVCPELVLADIRPIGDLGPGETSEQLDIADLDACEGADGILHFAGQTNESTWENVRANNIGGVYNLVEAAGGKACLPCHFEPCRRLFPPRYASGHRYEGDAG